MHHIVYQSYAVGQPSIADLKQLLQQARANNLAHHITGVLLYSHGSYLQVLEGETAVVKQLYEKIKVDYRHARVLTLADGAIQKRAFPDWTMGFQELSGDDFVRLSGYINPYRSNFLDAHLPDTDEGMLTLLKSFVMNDGSQW